MSTTADLRTELMRFVRTLEPDVMSGDDAASVVRDLAAIEKLAATGRMFAALRVARTDAWRGQGHASAADWLAAQAGISVSAAATQLGTAKKADRLPKTKDAMRNGELSPDEAGAVADAATADPEAEDDLLDTARHDTNRNLKDKAAKTKAAATDSAERERRIRARRSLRRGTDAEGAFYAHVYGPGIDAARFEELLRPFEEHVFKVGRANGTRDTYENRSYDALFLMLAYLQSQAPGATGATLDAASGTAADASSGTAAGMPEDGSSVATDSMDDGGTDETDETNQTDHRDEATPGADGLVSFPGAPHSPAAHSAGDPPARPPAWSPPWDPDPGVPLPSKLSGGQNVKVIVLIDHAALLRGRTEAGETCEITGVGPVSVATVRELMDDAFIAVAIRKGRDVVNVAHSGRGLNAHQRTALEATGLRCSNRACNRTIALQVDHRVPYHQDQVTKLDNQDPLCPICHPLKTHHGWELEEGSGPRRFLPPNDPRAPRAMGDRDVDLGSGVADPSVSRSRAAARPAGGALDAAPITPPVAEQPALI